MDGFCTYFLIYLKMYQIDSDQYDNELDFGDVSESLTQEQAREHPYNCIGYLLGHDANIHKRLCRGTGFLIGPDLVLTVAHNIYNRVEKTQNIDFIFYPGVSGQLGKKDGYKIVDIRFPEKYKTCAGNETLKYDYALLKLDRNVVREKYIELGINYVHNKQVLAMYGYRDCDNSFAIQKGLWKANAHQTDLPAIMHRITTLEGNSGSPLIVRRNGRCVAIGIHKGGKKGTECNGGRAITNDLVMDLLVWEKEMASDIRLCLMAASPNIATEVQPDSWLAQLALKINIILQGFKTHTEPSSFTLKKPNPPLPQKKIENISSKQPSPAKVEQIKPVKKEPSFSKQENPSQLKPPQAFNNLQQLSIEIKEQFLDSLATALETKLQAIAPYQKKQITSLTLKVTCKRDIMKGSKIHIMQAYAFHLQSVQEILQSRYHQYDSDGIFDATQLVQQDAMKLYIVNNKEQTLNDLSRYCLRYEVKRMATCVRQLRGLRNFSLYCQFQLISHQSFLELRDTLNSLPELTRINIVVDPSMKKYQQKNNWAQGWVKGKDPNKSVKYEKWN